MQRNGNPRVSVVVPTRNEARNLEVVLPAIAAVRPAVHEIIVVDGNSVDGTIETAQRVLPWVKVITQTRKGKGNAMACGFAAATGDVVVMFDADGSADPGRDPGVRAGAGGGRRFRQGQSVRPGGRKRRHHPAAQDGQRRAQRCGERAVRHVLHRPLLRLQRVLVRPAAGARPAGHQPARAAAGRHALGRRLRDRDRAELPRRRRRDEDHRGAVDGAGAHLRPDQPADLRRRHAGAAHAGRRAPPGRAQARRARADGRAVPRADPARRVSRGPAPPIRSRPRARLQVRRGPTDGRRDTSHIRLALEEEAS